MALSSADVALAPGQSGDLEKPASTKPAASAAWHIKITDDIADVEVPWRRLEAKGIDSPGQSYEFVKVWIENFSIPNDEQRFVVVERSRRPLLVLALHKQSMFGLVVWMPFGGSHVSSHAPLMDLAKIRAMPPEERVRLWKEIKSQLCGDLVCISNMRAELVDVFEGTELSTASDTLFRAEFDSWESCDSLQRSRSRRKHDKQQGAKLAAFGEVTFEEIDRTGDADAALEVLFADRAARFAEQGIADPFLSSKIRAFYRSIFESGVTLAGKLHVLKLNGRIVGTRYNLVHDDRMFCLISSMAVDAELQPGSPGKQILVHLMQRIFAQGIRRFDMGAGFSDEKRHWCNVSEALSNVYLPITWRGRLLATALVGVAWLRAKAKSNRKLFGALRDFRALVGRRAAAQTPASPASE